MTQEGVTALYSASQEGHVIVVRLLLENGADVNICKNVLLHVHVCMSIFSHLAVCYICVNSGTSNKGHSE